MGLKGLYLFSYCTLQTVLHLALVAKTVYLVVNGEFEWLKVSQLAFGATLLQFVDVLHCLIGLTKGNVAASLLQIIGRLTVLYLLHVSPETRDGPASYLLVLVYALVEPCRYPYYGFNALGMELYPLLWLRYSAFLPLYPAGLTLEAINMALAIPYFYNHYRFVVLGIPLNVGVILGIFLVTLFPFIAKFLFSHMSKQRRAKLGGGPTKSQSKSAKKSN